MKTFKLAVILVIIIGGVLIFLASKLFKNMGDNELSNNGFVSGNSPSSSKRTITPPEDIKVIREYVAKGKTEKALELFEHYNIPNYDLEKEIKDKITLLRGRLASIKGQVQTGMISDEDASTQITKINSTVLQLISELVEILEESK